MGEHNKDDISFVNTFQKEMKSIKTGDVSYNNQLTVIMNTSYWSFSKIF